MQHYSPKYQNKISDFNGKHQILSTVLQERSEESKVLHNLDRLCEFTKSRTSFCIINFDSNNIREEFVDVIVLQRTSGKSNTEVINKALKQN